MFLYKYSQNNLHSKNLIRQLLAKTSISLEDTVLDIGAGNGVLTEELCSRAKKVLAIEIDPVLAYTLKKNFHNCSNVEVFNDDFFNYTLPTENYKVFSNIPFTFTSDILRKLVWGGNSADELCLTMQKEAAEKFLGIQKNTLISILLKARYDSTIIYEFSSRDFKPSPKIRAVQVKFSRRANSEIKPYQLTKFDRFVEYGYTKYSQNVRKGLCNKYNHGKLLDISREYNINMNKCCTDFDYEEWVKLFHVEQI